jgi:hypothetical protein
MIDVDITAVTVVSGISGVSSFERNVLLPEWLDCVAWSSCEVHDR